MSFQETAPVPVAPPSDLHLPLPALIAGAAEYAAAVFLQWGEA